VLVASLSGHARASGAWISSGPLEPVEQRVAVSVGPDRTTTWTSLRFDASAGKVGIVVPAPPGASLDFSSDAWFEALEVATAPRIFPPADESPYCPGTSGPAAVFDLAGQVAHVKSLPVDDVAVLDDAGAVALWAAEGGLDLSPALASALGALGGVRFVAVRFVAPAGPSVTRTLRVAMPGAAPLLPLALTRAGSKPLLVTTFTLGAGRATATGSAAVTIPPGDLAWDAKAKKSNYFAARAASLAAEGSDGFVAECAGAPPLATNVSIAGGTASIDGLITAYFDRAAAYGDGQVDPTSCIAAAAVALTSSSPVAASCPRADLGVVDVDPAPLCVEKVQGGAVDPAKLRCGGVADDIAVALSGLYPTEAWITRQSAQIPAGGVGADWPLAFNGGASISPVRTAKSLDLAGCNSMSTSASTGVASGGMSTGASTSGGDSGAGGMIFSGVGGSNMSVSVGAGGSGNASGSGSIDVRPIDVNCGCSGTADTSTTSSDSCDGSSDTSSGSCSGDSSSGDTCSGDTSSGSGCDGSSGSDTSCDSGGGDTSCDSGGGDLNCSGGSSDCSAFGARGNRKIVAPRFSVLALALVGLMAPLRRRGRRSRLRASA
jgi:hypothetical protein